MRCPGVLGSTTLTSSRWTRMPRHVALRLVAVEEVRSEHIAILERRQLAVHVGDVAVEHRPEALGDRGDRVVAAGRPPPAVVDDDDEGAVASGAGAVGPPSSRTATVRPDDPV